MLRAFGLREFFGSVLVNEVAEIIALLTLPLAGAALHLPELHVPETLVISVIPLKHIFDTCSLLEFPLFPPEVWLEFRKILFH